MICPYCGGRMQSNRVLPPLRPMHQRIYDAVAASGEEGILTTDLIKVMHPGRRYRSPGVMTTIRVQVHDTNAIIAPYGQRIVGRLGTVRTGRYYLVSKGEVKCQPRQSQ